MGEIKKKMNTIMPCYKVYRLKLYLAEVQAAVIVMLRKDSKSSAIQCLKGQKYKLKELEFLFVANKEKNTSVKYPPTLIKIPTIPHLSR